MRVLVTGGAGFIGSHVVDRLIAHDHEVSVVDDLSTGKLSNLEEPRRERRVRFHAMDVRSGDLETFMTRQQPEVVCHLASQAVPSRASDDPRTDLDVNVGGLMDVLAACVRTGVRKVVYAGSSSMYGPLHDVPAREDHIPAPVKPYGIVRLAAERYLRWFRAEHGLSFTSLVLSNVYGPRQEPMGEAGVVAAFAEALTIGATPKIFGDGSATRDLLFVGDAAHAFVLALSGGEDESFHISTGIETSVSQLYTAMAAQCGVSEPPELVPARAHEIPRSALDPAKASRGLGWTPFTGLDAGLRETLDWYRSRSG